MILNFPEQRVGEELIALAINLATNPRNAEIMSEGDQLEKLFQRAIKYRDSLLMKLIRNISFSAKISHVQDTIYSFGQDLINLMVKPHEEADFLVESLGTLVNLEQTAWDELLTSTKILEFLHKSLSVGYADDDIVLESIMLVGTLVSNSKSAQMIANSMIIKQLHTLLSEKQEDDEMVQQILFTFYKMVFYKETREIILHQTQVVNYMLELLQDKNPRIRRMADTVLSVVQEVDPNWSQQIRHKRFQLYNQEWIQAVQNLEQWAMESDSEGEDMEDEDQFQNWMWGYEQEEEEEEDDYD